MFFPIVGVRLHCAMYFGECSWILCKHFIWIVLLEFEVGKLIICAKGLVLFVDWLWGWGSVCALCFDFVGLTLLQFWKLV